MSDVRSVAMVEATIGSSATDPRVLIADVMDRALARAIDVERVAAVRKILERWAVEGLTIDPR